MIITKGGPLFEADSIRYSCVISHYRLHVEGKVSCIQRKALVKHILDPTVMLTGYGDRLSPEQSVMNTEKLGFRLGRPLETCHTGIYRKGHLVNLRPGVSHLQSVEGIVGPRYFLNRQQRVKIRYYFT